MKKADTTPTLQRYDSYSTCLSDKIWLISDSLCISNISFVIRRCCWAVTSHKSSRPPAEGNKQHTLGTPHSHATPVNPPLTLGISSGGQHGDGPTHSQFGGVDGSRLCHGPGSEAGWEKEALSLKIPAPCCTVWSTRSLSPLTQLPAMKVIAVEKVPSLTILLADTEARI